MFKIFFFRHFDCSVMKWSEMEKSPALEIFGNIQMAVISRLHYIALEMTLSVFELLEESQVVLEEHSKVVDLVFQHCDAFDAHAESITCVFFRVDI